MSRKATPSRPVIPFNRRRPIAQLAEVATTTLTSYLNGLTVRPATAIRIERALRQAAAIDADLSGKPDPHGLHFNAAVAALVAGRP